MGLGKMVLGREKYRVLDVAEDFYVGRARGVEMVAAGSMLWAFHKVSLGRTLKYLGQESCFNPQF